MTYAERAIDGGRQAVQIVELYLPRCTRTYGTAPCTAAVGVTGADRCYNTRATCQDPANFAQADKVYRFATTRVDGIQQAGDAPTFPTLLAVDSAPSVLTPSQGLGVRASVSISILDHPWTDSGIDPYRTLRATDPDGRGTFWGKFVTRNKFYENRRLDVLTGFLNADGSYDAANFKRRTYVISRIAGPSATGTVTIEGKDPLTFADGEKAKWPAVSMAKLTSDITDSATSIAITDPELALSAWWALGQRYFKIETEIMRATAISGTGTTSVTLTVVRANMPAIYDPLANVANAHAADATVQPCHWFDHAPVYDIVYFLLNTVAGIPSSYLDFAGWKAYFDANFADYIFSAMLAEPADVKTLLTEITQLNVLLFWHDREQVVKMRALRYFQLLGPQINDAESIVSDSLSVTEDVKNLTTRSIFYYDVQWPLALMKELRSYRVVDVSANLDREDATQYGKPANRQITSRWLFRENAGLVRELGATFIRQYQDVRKAIQFTIDPKDDTRWTGDMVGVSSRYVQDENGDPIARNYLITEVAEIFDAGGIKLKCTAVELFSYWRTGVIGPNTLSTYSASPDSGKNHYAFISPNTPAGNPLFADLTKAYQIV